MIIISPCLGGNSGTSLLCQPFANSSMNLLINIDIITIIIIILIISQSNRLCIFVSSSLSSSLSPQWWHHYLLTNVVIINTVVIIIITISAKTWWWWLSSSMISRPELVPGLPSCQCQLPKPARRQEPPGGEWWGQLGFRTFVIMSILIQEGQLYKNHLVEDGGN